jgi:hypothetical protein
MNGGIVSSNGKGAWFLQEALLLGPGIGEAMESRFLKGG